MGMPDHMNSKEQLPSHTDEDTPELPDALKQALRDAYPDAGGRIAARVMEQIRAEREDSERKTRAERAERRRHRHGLIMKYGGMAACMVILSGALVIASPLMGRTTDNAAAADQAIMTAAYAADMGAPAEAVYSVKTKSTADAANGAVETVLTEAEEEVPMMLFSTRTADPAAEEAAPAALLADAAAEEAYNDADDSKEAFLQYLIHEGHLTEEDFTNWQSTLETADAWTPQSLCQAFQLDETLYDTWLKK